MKAEKKQGEGPKWMAYHEAGHAVVADYFDALQWVQLDPEPATAADAGMEAIDGPVLYGGILAQARYQRVSVSSAFLSASREDLDELMQLVSRSPTALPPEERLEVYRQVVRTILSGRWAAVEAVAASLLERGLLLDVEVRSIVQNHLPGVSDRPPLVVK